MIIRTKKFQMNKSQYIKKGFFNLLIEQWWVFIIYLGICGMHYFIPSLWWIIGGSIALFLKPLLPITIALYPKDL